MKYEKSIAKGLKEASECEQGEFITVSRILVNEVSRVCLELLDEKDKRQRDVKE